MKVVYPISVGRALSQGCISQSKGTKGHLQNTGKWHVFKIRDKRSWRVKWIKALPAPEGCVPQGLLPARCCTKTGI